MFFFDWLWEVLYQLGFLKKEATILLLGLDNAGKTTLLHKLKYGAIRSFVPTQRAQLEEIVLGNVKFCTWDLGGHRQVRNLWKDYYFDADAIIFLVDSSDTERMLEAKEELHCLLKDSDLNDTLFVVLGNKTDLPSSLTQQQLIEALELSSFMKEAQSLQIFMCSLINDTGYQSAFQWLSNKL